MSEFYRLIGAITLAISCTYSVGCATVDRMKVEKDTRFSENSIWIDEPHDQTPKAVIVMLHGLNLRPSKMDGWAQLLQNHGALIMRFALFGHSGQEGDMSQVHEDIWREQFKETITTAQAKAHVLGVPLYFVGFSLGALVALEWLAQQPKSEPPLIDKMVLIAPAIATPWYSRAAVSFISWFGRSFTMPSRSPKHYRANSGTSVAAYQALFALKNSLENMQFKNANIPTLLMIDKYDELVPSSNIKKIITQYRLSNWVLDIVDNRFAHDNYGFRHLMVDEESVGKHLWDELGKKVLSHLRLAE